MAVDFYIKIQPNILVQNKGSIVEGILSALDSSFSVKKRIWPTEIQWMEWFSGQIRNTGIIIVP